MTSRNLFAVLVLLSLSMTFQPDAMAATNNPGSLLLFPHYDTQGHSIGLMTVSNVSSKEVWLRLVWIADSD